MNTSDTEILLGILSQQGYRRTAKAADADVVLLNTCAIRDHAEQKILCRLGELKSLKRDGRGSKSRSARRMHLRAPAYACKLRWQAP